MKKMKQVKYKLRTITVTACNYEERKITTDNEAVNLLRTIYQGLDQDQEHFTVLVLNGRNKIIGYKVLFSGGQTSSTVDLKVLFRNVLLMGGTAIIVAHNHPSGEPTPTDEDRKITMRIKQGCKLLAIGFLDHIILGKNDYYSFCNNSNLLERG